MASESAGSRLGRKLIRLATQEGVKRKDRKILLNIYNSKTKSLNFLIIRVTHSLIYYKNENTYVDSLWSRSTSCSVDFISLLQL